MVEEDGAALRRPGARRLRRLLSRRAPPHRRSSGRGDAPTAPSSTRAAPSTNRSPRTEWIESNPWVAPGNSAWPTAGPPAARSAATSRRESSGGHQRVGAPVGHQEGRPLGPGAAHRGGPAPGLRVRLGGDLEDVGGQVGPLGAPVGVEQVVHPVHRQAGLHRGVGLLEPRLVGGVAGRSGRPGPPGAPRPSLRPPPRTRGRPRARRPSARIQAMARFRSISWSGKVARGLSRYSRSKTTQPCPRQAVHQRAALPSPPPAGPAPAVHLHQHRGRAAVAAPPVAVGHLGRVRGRRTGAPPPPDRAARPGRATAGGGGAAGAGAPGRRAPRPPPAPSPGAPAPPGPGRRPGRPPTARSPPGPTAPAQPPAHPAATNPPARPRWSQRHGREPVRW